MDDTVVFFLFLLSLMIKACKLQFEPSQFQLNELGANFSQGSFSSNVVFSFQAPLLDKAVDGATCLRRRTVSLVGLTDTFPVRQVTKFTTWHEMSLVIL